MEVGAEVSINIVAICGYLTQFGSVNAYLAIKLHDSFKDREAVLVLPRDRCIQYLFAACSLFTHRRVSMIHTTANSINQKWAGESSVG